MSKKSIATIRSLRAEVERLLEEEIDELAEAARLLGATQAKRLFGCYSDEDRRFELAMRESMAKHRTALRELLAHPAITHCDNCGCDWLDNGLNPIGCPYCKQSTKIKRLEKMLSAYQAAVNKIDDLIEYSLPMPPGTKAALYAVLANLTATLAKELTNE